MFAIDSVEDKSSDFLNFVGPFGLTGLSSSSLLRWGSSVTFSAVPSPFFEAVVLEDKPGFNLPLLVDEDLSSLWSCVGSTSASSSSALLLSYNFSFIVSILYLMPNLRRPANTKIGNNIWNMKYKSKILLNSSEFNTDKWDPSEQKWVWL